LRAVRAERFASLGKRHAVLANGDMAPALAAFKQRRISQYVMLGFPGVRMMRCFVQSIVRK
jgi:hypothetical protein